jgi:proline iminopeptidase
VADLYPPIEPYEHGWLDVGDGHRVYWETCGDPSGTPALVLHGGPGAGCTPASRRYLDASRYRIVLLDQRGCGRSTPHAADPATDMRHNTTHHLIADMERLRQHLGIQRWLLYGASWGSTLSLAYAERHPDRVTEMVIAAVTMSLRADLDWLYRGVGRFFPEAWERFFAASGHREREGDILELLSAYARLTEDPDPAVRERATAAWCAWEDAVVSLENGGGPPAPFSARPEAAQLGMVRICAHYFSHAAWLAEGELLRCADRLAGIPGVLVHGRQDLGGPPHVPWELSRVWTDAELTLVDSAGHTGNDLTRHHVRTALDRFARG